MLSVAIFLQAEQQNMKRYDQNADSQVEIHVDIKKKKNEKNNNK